MEYQKTIEAYFQRISKKDFRQTLGPVQEICQLLGNPQESFSAVHITGTNGKGSTAAFLNAILQKAGYQAGLMTSPHLLEPTERIQIQRQNISWEALWEVIQKIRHFLPEEDYLSYFEMMTVAGFDYFAQMGIDIAVVEVGMGGRLDATNVLKPQVAILTPISYDHQDYLGESLIKITQEKCGILKPEMTVVSAPQTAEAAYVIEKKCEQLELELIWADPAEITTPLGLKGGHQKTNAACALAAAKILLSEDRIEAVAWGALRNTVWRGRMEYLGKDRTTDLPTVLVDGAHNTAGIQVLADYLKEAHPDKNIYFLIGVLKDKNWQTMFKPLAEIAKGFFCITPDSARALPAEVLAKSLIPFGKPVSIIGACVAPSAGKARGASPSRPLCGLGKSPWRFTLKNLRELPPQGPQDLLVACGSLYVIGDFLRCLNASDA